MKANLIKIYDVKNKEDGTTDVVITYKDENNEKHMQVIKRATIPFYVVKDRNDLSHPPFMPIDKLEEKTVYYDMLHDAIEQEIGLNGFTSQCKAKNKERDARVLHKHPLIYGSDVDLCDSYIARFNLKHEQITNPKLSKGYFDIEVDTINIVGFPSPEEARAPINSISYMNGDTKKMIVFILRKAAKSNRQIAKYEKEVSSHQAAIEKDIKEVDDIDVSVSTLFYDSELDMLEAFFGIVNNDNPDYMLAWNISFDIKYILNRIERLVGKKQSYVTKMNIMCSEEYIESVKSKVWFNESRMGPNDSKWDEFNISSGTNWVCQMLLYANVRRGQGAIESYRLDAIANTELGKEKLPFLPGETISNIPYKDFSKFISYNVRDTLLLYLLEEKLMDVNTVHTLANITNTRLSKTMKNTISIANFIDKFSRERGLIKRNNINLEFGNEGVFSNIVNKKDPFADLNDAGEFNEYIRAFHKKDNTGGYVANPKLNDSVGVPLTEEVNSSNVFNNVCDKDLASLYPSEIRAFNIDSSTQVGKYFLLSNTLMKRMANDNRYNDGDSKTELADIEYPEMGMHIVDSVISKDYIGTGKKFFGLPTTEEILDRISSKQK